MMVVDWVCVGGILLASVLLKGCVMNSVHEITRSILPPSRRLGCSRSGLRVPNPGLEYLKPLESGTTIVALKFKDGLMFAADRRTAAGYSIVSWRTKKIQSIARLTLIGFAGSVADGQEVVDTIQGVNSTFEENFGIPITIKGQAQYLVGLCRDAHEAPYEIEMLVGGMNFYGSYELFEIGYRGCLFKKSCDAIGSGSTYAQPTLDEYTDEEMASFSMKDALCLAVKAIIRAGRYDAGTSPSQMVLPTVAVVARGGIKFLEEKQIEKVRNRIVTEGGQNV